MQWRVLLEIVLREQRRSLLDDELLLTTSDVTLANDTC